MSATLLDVNVLVALWWPAHTDHHRVHRWFAANAMHGWATCPLTQTAFIRIVSNPAFSRDAVSPKEALDLLAANLNHSAHRFWPDAVDSVAAMSPVASRLRGHKQITDAYLLGLAIHNRGRLATLDRSLLDLLPAKHPTKSVLLI